MPFTNSVTGNMREPSFKHADKVHTSKTLSIAEKRKVSKSIASLPNYNDDRKRRFSSSEEPHNKKPKIFKQQTSSEKRKNKLRRRYRNADLIDINLKSKRIWEDLRCKSCPKEKKIELSSQLLDLIKGNLSQFMYAHDTARIIECILSNGNFDARNVIYSNLKANIIDMSKNVYSSFLIMKMIKHGTREQRAEIINAMKGEVVSLMKHKVAFKVVEYIYNEYANASQRSFILQEFYSNELKVFKDDAVLNLKTALLKYPNKQPQMLDNLKCVLLDLLQKGIVQPSIFHTLLLEYICEAPSCDKAVMIESCQEVLITILHTRDGSRAAMQCLWNGTSKNRKIILKTLKGHIFEVATNENGYLVLLAAFDTVDDTVLLTKIIFQELRENLGKLIENEYGRKVLVYLVAPRDSQFFHPDIVNLLKQGDSNLHSKKDSEVRKKELLNVAIGPILTEIQENLPVLIDNPKTGLFLSVCLGACADPSAKKSLNFLLARIIRQSKEWIEKPGLQIILKKVIAMDKDIVSIEDTFSYEILKEISEDCLTYWLNCNRGCFSLIAMLECGNTILCDFVTKKLMPFTVVLRQVSHKGGVILRNKLQEL